MQMPTATRNAFANLLESFSQPGRTLMRRYAPFATLQRRLGLPAPTANTLEDLANALLSGRGEASGVAIAADMLELYETADETQKGKFFTILGERFNPDEKKIAAAWEKYQAKGASALPGLAQAVEAPRQELFRRLNLAPGGTGALVRMRADLLSHMKKNDPVLGAVDADLAHLLGSWFNRGFLTMRSIDWSSPAALLERVIKYEAVHDITSWDELRRRLDPTDRRCFGFFHPAMPDEPLIFVEVGLTTDMPDSIQDILSAERSSIAAEDANTAVFYSISNCQPGLKGISFGHFLIKQVATDLKRELPRLTRFVTLSPVPGFMGWLKKTVTDPEGAALVKRLKLAPAGGGTKEEAEAARIFMLKQAVTYFTEARLDDGRPIDPVARFHLGNGSRLERMNWLADTSQNGLNQSGGLMVNYLYDLRRIEEYHEAYVSRGSVVTGEPFWKLAKQLTEEPKTSKKQAKEAS